MIGPEVGGCRPVIMTFRLFKDRDEVFRKAGMLRGSSLHISEDVTRCERLLNINFVNLLVSHLSISISI